MLSSEAEKCPHLPFPRQQLYRYVVRFLISTLPEIRVRDGADRRGEPQEGCHAVLLCLSGLGIAFLRMSAGCVCKIGKMQTVWGFCPGGSRLMSLRLSAELFNSAVSLGQTDRDQAEFE